MKVVHLLLFTILLSFSKAVANTDGKSSYKRYFPRMISWRCVNLDSNIERKGVKPACQDFEFSQWEILKIEASRTSQQLDSLYLEMKKFVKFAGFDAESFVKYSPVLREEFLEIVREESEPFIVEFIQKQVDFIAELYDIMSVAAEKLSITDSHRDIGDMFISKLYNLHIEILILHDSAGFLDVDEENVADRLQRYRAVLNQMVAEMRLISKVSTLKTNKFYQLVSRTEQVMDVLRSQTAYIDGHCHHSIV